MGDLLSAQARTIARNADFYDDSSSKLGLNHARNGGTIDGKGRPVVTLPAPQQPGYRKELDGKVGQEFIDAADALDAADTGIGDQLLQPEITISKGGGSKPKARKKERKDTIGERNIKRDRAMQEASDPNRKETDLERAYRLHQENLQRIDAGPRPGRPLKGREPRMRVSTRLEPGTVIDLASTGKDYSEILEGVQGILALSRTGAQANEILDAVAKLVEERPQ